MKHTKLVRKACATAVMAACASGAMAFEFETDSGWTGSLNTTLSAGAAWRAEGIDKGVYAAENAVQNGLFVGTGPLGGTAANGNRDSWAGQARAAGWASGGKNQAGKYNYDKGDLFSNTYKFVSDLNFKKDNISGLVRVKGWYDDVLNNSDVPWGSQAAGMAPWTFRNNATGTANLGSTFGKPLSDNGSQALSKFDGIYLLDAYVSANFDMGAHPAQVRFGRQAINWGESIFIQGVNQISPIDVNSARRAGSELKEAFLPIWALQASIGLDDGMSLEGFYQLKHEATALEACGTYWAGNYNLYNHPGACNMYSSFLPGVPGNTPNMYWSDPSGLGVSIGQAVLGSLGLSTGLANALAAAPPNGLGLPATLATTAGNAIVKGIVDGYGAAQVPTSFMFENGPGPSDSGQWGLAFRMPVDALDAELGLYAMNIHSRLPALAVNVKAAAAEVATGVTNAINATALPANVKAALIAPTVANMPGKMAASYGAVGQFGALASKAIFEYPEDIKIYGASLSGTVQGISYGVELSRQENVPVNRNTADNYAMFTAMTGYTGNPATTCGTTANPCYGLVASAQSATIKSDILSGKLMAGKKYNLYERFDKWQFQTNVVASLSEFPKMIGAMSGSLIGEVGFEWNNVPDYKKAGVIRYGRPDMFGFASFIDPAAGANQNTCTAGTSVTMNRSSACKADGFVTDFSWGYRLRLAVDYPDFLGSGFVASPSIFWAQDVDGVSMTGAFSEGNTTLGLGLKLNLNKVHDINLGYTSYTGKWNTFRDSDNYSVSYSYSF